MKIVGEETTRTLFFIIFGVCIFLGCKKEDNNPVNNNLDTNDKYFVASKDIGVSGGTISLDNITLDIPSGALQNSQNISILKPKEGVSMSERGFELVVLEPSGLIFTNEANLTLSYSSTANKNNHNMVVYVCNNGNWELVNIISNDTSNHKLKIGVKHFSIFLAFVPNSFLVVDIPGKYLWKADLIFCMATTPAYPNSFHWFPGHVGMYLGTRTPTSLSNDGYTIIESSPPISNGVNFGSITDFIESSDHLFMGTRRYNGNLSESERNEIATFAISKKGSYYSLVAQQPQGGFFSCVGLTEASYDHVDKSNIPWYQEIPYSLPFDQFRNTVPVGEINIHSGERLSIKVYGIEYSKDGGGYIKSGNGVTVTNSFSNSTWEESSDHLYWTFSWTPTERDVGRSQVMIFSMYHPPDADYNKQDLTIHVTPSYSEYELSDDENTIALWHFNEGSGTTVKDEVSNDNNGIISNASWADGRFGKGIKFGSNGKSEIIVDFIDGGSLSKIWNSDFTIEAWVKIDQIRNDIQCIIDFGDPNIDQCGLRISENGYPELKFSSGNGTVRGSTQLEIGKWYHIAGIAQGNTTKLYINGVTVRSSTRTNVNYDFDLLKMGNLSDGGNNTEWFKGTLDEVRISNIARSY